jgi:hypothetical protein
MSTAELKLSLHELIEGTTDSSVLEAVFTLLSKVNSNYEDDWYSNLSDEAKASIQRGLDDAKNKRFVPYSEIKAKANKLLGRTNE